MSNISLTRYSAKSKPPVNKNKSKNIYTRSTSSTRITAGSNIGSIGNTSPAKVMSNLSSTKTTGSLHNLSHYAQNPGNKSNDYPSARQDNHKTLNGNCRSATNNSFGTNSSISPSASKGNFYNGYSDQKLLNSKTTGNYHKSGSSGSSSTNSPEASGNTISNSLSGSVRDYHTKTSSAATTTHSSSTYSSSSDSCNKYNGDSYVNGGNRNAAYSTNNPLPRSETTRSFNNSEPSGLVGLANLGNTCYMNSVLQCLSNCKRLHEYCISNKYDRDLNTSSKSHGNLIKSYAELMQAIWKSGSNYISPEKFRKQFQKIAVSFHGSTQQDSQEFLRIMLEGLHQDVNHANPKAKNSKVNEEEEERLSEQKLAELYWTRYITIDNSFIVELFVGQLKSTLVCKKCGHKSVTFDPFWDLSLPIPKCRRDSISLTECLDLFTSEEELDGDEMPKCSKCKVKRACTKRFSIKKFPPILVIHLKRFSGDRFRSKITTFIEFPTRHLDLQRYRADQDSDPDIVYNLYGVSNHSGTVYGGHYTAYCCNPYSKCWYLYNDTRVQRVDENSVCSPEAYVLFYESVHKHNSHNFD